MTTEPAMTRARRVTRSDNGPRISCCVGCRSTGVLKVCAILVLAVLAACAGVRKEKALQEIPLTGVSRESLSPTPPAAPEKMFRQTGTAGWYDFENIGSGAHAGATAEANAMTAAHRTLPLGRIIHVTNLGNAKNIDVTITRRGPLAGNRIIDLSLGAARELDFVAQGTAQVSIETPEDGTEEGPYTVLAANFLEEDNARMLKARLSGKYELISIVPFETGIARFYRVLIGSYDSEERAGHVAAKLVLEGLEPVVMRKD